MTGVSKATSTYNTLLREIRERIRSAQYEALRAVNKELIELYWDVGRTILKRQKEEGWGKSVVERLAADLQKDFPGVQGLSSSNLWRMKLFYETYSAKVKLAPLVREIGWTHNGGLDWHRVSMGTSFIISIDNSPASDCPELF